MVDSSLDGSRLPHDHPLARMRTSRGRRHSRLTNYAWGMNRHGQAMGGAILPEMMRRLWRDQPVSTDPRDMVERSFRTPPAQN
jgi:hypothetical protein